MYLFLFSSLYLFTRDVVNTIPLLGICNLPHLHTVEQLVTSRSHIVDAGSIFRRSRHKPETGNIVTANHSHILIASQVSPLGSPSSNNLPESWAPISGIIVLRSNDFFNTCFHAWSKTCLTSADLRRREKTARHSVSWRVLASAKLGL